MKIERSNQPNLTPEEQVRQSAQGDFNNAGLKPNIMTASGSPGFSLCAANYHPGRLAKDVSGSQHNQSVWWFHEQGVFQYM